MGPANPTESQYGRPPSRRRYERVPLYQCALDVFCPGLWRLREKRVPDRVVGVDLSESGMRFAGPSKLEIGQKIRVVARLELFRDTIEGQGTVVWCAANARGTGEFLVGIEWTSLAPGHHGKIQQIRKATRSKEFQQKLQTKSRERVEKDKSDGSDLIEYKPPPEY